MKKTGAAVLAALMLCSCGSKQDASSQKPDVPADSSGQETPPEETGTVREATYPEEEYLKAYRDGMQPYELVRIAFLGEVTEDQSYRQVLQRALTLDDFQVVGEVDDAHTADGQHGEYADAVYLIIPNRGVSLTIGKRSEDGTGTEEIWYRSEDDGPVLFAERGDTMDAPSLIHAVRGEEYDYVLTGFDAAYGRLRTEQHMGVTDVTPYDVLEGGEIPMYAQICFDSLQSFGEVEQYIRDGREVWTVGEQIIEGNVCIVYVLNANEDNQVFYAMHWDVGEHEPYAYKSADGTDWTEVPVPKG